MSFAVPPFEKAARKQWAAATGADLKRARFSLKQPRGFSAIKRTGHAGEPK
jgi:hypothetical protein